MRALAAWSYRHRWMVLGLWLFALVGSNALLGAVGNGVTVGVAGQLAAEAEPPSVGGIGFGILTAGIVLFLVFGSLFAAAMPLASALVSLGTATAVIGLLSNAVGMPEFSGQLV